MNSYTPGVKIFSSGSGYKASTLTASQEVMKWLILNSDGNVAIQTFNRPHVADPEGVACEARLYCTKCKESRPFSIDCFRDESSIIDKLGWAKQHKHGIVSQEADTPTTPGERKLKVVV